MKTLNKILNIVVSVIGLIVFILFVMAIFSCKTIRDISKSSSDSTTVKKSTTALVDTSIGGNVKKTTSKEDYDWWKRTETYKPPAPGVTNVYPSTIVYEGGKGSKETNQIDSGWFKNQLSLVQAQLDSTNAKNEDYRKQSETKTKGLGLFMVILICIGCIVGYIILNKTVLNKFKIIRT